MTQPRTMSLNPYEWRQLVVAGAQGVSAWANVLQKDVPTAAEVDAMHAALDRLKLQVSAWGISGAGAHPYDLATRPKKRGGWPLGKKRGPRTREARQ